MLCGGLFITVWLLIRLRSIIVSLLGYFFLLNYFQIEFYFLIWKFDLVEGFVGFLCLLCFLEGLECDRQTNRARQSKTESERHREMPVICPNYACKVSRITNSN